jgi:diacylglycerol kinase family enzyme
MIKNKFKNCLVIANSNGTHIKRAMNLVGQLNEYLPEQIEMIEISNLDYDAIAKLLTAKAGRLGPTSLICIAGGDGTINCIINILLTTKGISQKARQASILPLWGGNGNDLAVMANGQANKVTLKRVLHGGEIVAIHPLAIRLEHQKHSTLKLATCYASFGIIASISTAINRPEYRRKSMYNHPFVRTFVEAGIIVKAFILAKPFTIDLGDEAGQEHTALYDFVVINGSRMAKRERFPVQLTDQKFIEASIRRKSAGLISYLQHAMNWRTTRPSKTALSLTIHDSIWMQLDGEVTKIPSHTTISIKLHPTTFNLLSIKLR